MRLFPTGCLFLCWPRFQCFTTISFITLLSQAFVSFAIAGVAETSRPLLITVLVWHGQINEIVRSQRGSSARMTLFSFEFLVTLFISSPVCRCKIVKHCHYQGMARSGVLVT